MHENRHALLLALAALTITFLTIKFFFIMNENENDTRNWFLRNFFITKSNFQILQNLLLTFTRGFHFILIEIYCIYDL